AEFMKVRMPPKCACEPGQEYMSSRLGGQHRVGHNSVQAPFLLRKSAEVVEVNRPAGLHLFDQTDDLFAAATRPDLLSQGSKLGQIDGFLALVQRMDYHPLEIKNIRSPLSLFSCRREHRAVLVGQGRLQRRDAVAETASLVLGPDRCGERLFDIGTV